MADEITSLARRYRWQVNMGTVAVPSWQTVLGVTEFKPANEPTQEDDSDYESGWKKTTRTALAWKVEAKISHKFDPNTGAFHPVHVKLRDSSVQFGSGSRVQVRYYDREGRADAWQGWCLVTWTPDAGDHAQLDRVAVVLTGDDELVSITNPINESPLPIISSLSPATGAEAGGELIIITGGFFTGATDVDFGANPATDYDVISDTKIAAIAPAGTGTVRVSVTTPNGVSADTAADNYIYTA